MMTKVYVMMFDDVPKYSSLTFEGVEKMVKHQMQVHEHQRHRKDLPLIWIKEVGEEEPVKSEVVS